MPRIILFSSEPFYGIFRLTRKAIRKRNQFQQYFGGNLPLLSVSGRQYHVEEYFFSPPTHGETRALTSPNAMNAEMEVQALPKETATPDVVSSAVHTALHIHKNMDPGDILIFMPGEQEIQRARGMLAATSSALNVIPLHGSLSKRAQDRIFEPSEQRRCIISTNIAETSLTIKNVVYVIDSA